MPRFSEKSLCFRTWRFPFVLLQLFALAVIVAIIAAVGVDGVDVDDVNPQPNKSKSVAKGASSKRASPGTEPSTPPITQAAKKPPTKVISLAESINRSQKKSLQEDPIELKQRSLLVQQQWKKALKEIKDIAVDYSKQTKGKAKGSSSKGFLTGWKLLLEDAQPKLEVDPETNYTQSVISVFSKGRTEATPSGEQMPRFEGFLSWERMVQDWTDDVQEYMAKVETSNANGNYSLSSFGLPTIDPPKKVDQNEEKVQIGDAVTAVATTAATAAPTAAGINDPKTQLRKLPNAKEDKSLVIPVPKPVQLGEEVVPQTDVADKSKNVWIVTTASLPWMTGTAVNPLLRAAYMTRGRKDLGGSVTLMLPWLERIQDQQAVYGEQRTFSSPAEQDKYVRTWLRDQAKLVTESQELNIEWYNAWQNKAENSLYSMGDITAQIPEEAVDIMILEEPEHLNWYRAPGQSWTNKFKHVIGIIHTNYFVYAQEQPAAFVRAPGMRLLCSWMCRAHCHRIVKLSGTLGQFAPEKELVENVHGVRASFLEVGEKLRPKLEKELYDDDPVFAPDAEPAVYFIGKMLWTKGLGSLIELLKYAEESAGIKIHVDMYGGGPNKDEAAARAKAVGVDLEFHGPIDHVELGSTHKIFINPSTSEVLCTTVAEALAMGKFVVVPSHPSNDFFAQFPNCLAYSSQEEFVGNLYYAMTHSPQPLSKEYAYALSWEAAIERLEAAGSIPKNEAELMTEALMSKQAGVEIRLPPLIEDEEDRKRVGIRLAKTRARYRLFRSRLASELQQSAVLPAPWKQRLIEDLDKRFDLDIDSLLESPKLRLKLSPAELDKRLLELYNSIADGPRGDIFRVIGGGNDVALQNAYIKQQAKKIRSYSNSMDRKRIPFFMVPERMLKDMSNEKLETPSQGVNLVLRRNLVPAQTEDREDDDHGGGGPKISMTSHHRPTALYSKHCLQHTSARSFVPMRSPAASCKLLL